jgi:radical SAM superfamily enzyme YgiQ (UPF0313 family)
MSGWRVAVQPGATVVSPNPDVVISFDLEGRLKTFFRQGTLIKRSLSSELHARRSVAGVRRRWRIGGGERLDIFERAREVAVQAQRDAIKSAEPTLRSLFAERLSASERWTPERLSAEEGRFARAYAPISILPPDQYGAIVVQGTFGCSWNRCSFCSFYQDRPFELRSTQALTRHLQSVVELLGDDARARRSLFLADGNALVLSNARLRPLFEASRNTFPGRPMASFVDVFSGEKKPLADFVELRSWGLEQVVVGLESGHEPLLRFINKPGGAEAAVDFITTLKAAGLRVGAIFMVGVGGRTFADGHLQDSISLIERLPLGRGDTIYLSPFVLHHGSAYADDAAREQIEALSDPELRDQQSTFTSAARRAHPQVQVARYPIDEFLY